MRAITFFLGPIGWILRIFWRMFRRYWVVLLILLYLFRGPLFSKPLARFLEKQFAKRGVAVRIQGVQGTYVTNISIRGIEVEPNDVIEKCKIEKLSFSYNLLAPLFGRRIFQKIQVDQPDLIIRKPASPEASTAQPLLPDSKPKSSFSDIDWGLILENGPNIQITDANCIYSQESQRIEISKFHWKTDPQAGQIAFEKLLLQPKDDKAKIFQDVHIAWQLQQRILTISEAKIRVPGYPSAFVLPKALEIDLSQQKVSLGKLDIPLPGGASLKGSIDFEQGCFLQLDHLSIAFEEITPLVEMVYTPTNPSCQASLQLYFLLDWPKWDIRELKGCLGLAIQRNPQQVPWSKANLVRGEFSTELWIEDMELLCAILSYFFPQVKDYPISGPLTLQQQFNPDLETQQIQSQGKLYSKSLKTNYFEPREFQSTWTWNSQIPKSTFALPTADFRLGATQLHLQGDADWHKSTIAVNSQGTLQELRLAEWARFFPKVQIQGSLDSQWQMQAEVPKSKRPDIAQSKIQWQQSVQARNLQFDRYSLPEARCNYTFSIQSQSCDLSKFNLELPNIQMKGQGKIHLGLPIQGQCKVEINIPSIEALWNTLGLPPIPISGGCTINIELDQFSWDQQAWHFQGKIAISLRHGKLKGLAFESIKTSIVFDASPNLLNIPSATIAWDKIPIFQGQTKWAPGPKQSFVKLKTYLPKIQNWLAPFIHTKSPMPTGNLEIGVEASGTWPDIKMLPADIQAKLGLKLSPGQYDQWKYSKLSAEIQGTLAQKQVVIQQAQIQWDKALTIQFKGKTSLEKHEISEAQIQCTIPAIASWVKPWEIPIQGTLQTKLKINGPIPYDWKFSEAQKPNVVWDILCTKARFYGREASQIRCAGKALVDSQKIEIPDLLLWLNKEKVWQAQAQWNSTDQTFASKGTIQIASVAQYWPLMMPQSEIPCPLQGKWNMAYQIQGQVPDTQHAQPKLAGNIQWELQDGQVSVPLGKEMLEQKYQRIQQDCSFELTPQKVEISKFSLNWDQDWQIQAQAKLDQTPGEDSHWQMTISGKQPGKYLSLWIAPAQFQTEQMELAIQGNGKLQPQQMEFTNQLRLTCTKTRCLNRYTFPKINLVSQAEWKDNCLTISSFNIQEAGQNFLEIRAQWMGWTKTTFGGTLQAHLPKIRYQDFVVRDMHLNLDINPKAISWESKARLGGGNLAFKGKVGHQDWVPDEFWMNMQGERVLLMRTEEIYCRATLNLELQGKLKKSQENWEVKGKCTGPIEITDLEIHKGMSLEQAPERVSFYPSLEIPGIDIALDVPIQFSKIKIENNIVNILTQGKLSIQGTLAQPEIQGWFKTQSGKLILPQGIMNIRECLIRFQPEDPLVPYLQIKAEAQVRDFRILVVIQGRWGDLSLEFSSMPPLPQEDIIMLLMTGATRNELQTAAGEKLKETGSFILMQQLLASVGLGGYVSAHITEESASITITPPEWNGFAIEGKVSKGNKMRFRLIYRLEYK